MTTRADLLRRLAEVADDLGAVTAPPQVRRQLDALCRSTRVALSAGSVSVARLHDGELVYESADGHGAEGIVSVRLPISRGIAGYVARSGQALIVEQVTQDPRFARDVAERVGYLPTSMLATPIVDDRGEVIGVLSVLDRGRQGADALAVASAFAEQAALVLPQIDLVVRLAPILVTAVADAVASGDEDLGAALRRQAARMPGDAADLAELAGLLADVRALNPDARAAAGRILGEFVRFASTTRRRR